MTDRKTPSNRTKARRKGRAAVAGRGQTASSPSRAQTPDTLRLTGFPVVGVGASAGGLEAIRELLQHMPTDIGMAFVLVQHLDPHHKSILTDLVSRVTDMPTVEASHGLQIEPNHIYVIPPRYDLAILNGVLQLMEPVAPRHLRHTIDYFFRSLARDQGPNAFCIVLSGAGSDGALGLREIKGEGGVALVQEPGTAAYDSMPNHADATGLADVILPPAEMGAWLKAYGRQLVLPGRLDQVLKALRSGGKADRLFVLVRNQTGYDFSLYKEGTVSRRIERRMTVNDIESLDDYVDYLQKTPMELDRLWKEFLIRVTQFFRNPKAFTALAEKVIPSLFEQRPLQEPVRVWVPGCSTGEEAYSIALLLQAELDRLGRTHSVQIFATDIDDEALEIARLAIYPPTIATDVPANFLRRYFLKHPKGFQVVKSVRSMLVFSRHDLTRDPPFSRMDLVSCRNLLIYMQPQLQNQVLDALTYALKSGGTLFLGNSESLGKFADSYDKLDAHSRIYRRHDIALRSVRSFQALPMRQRTFGLAGTTEYATEQVNDIQHLTQHTLMTEYTPACAVIDGNNQVLYIHGHTGQFLEPAIGRASMDILKMAREGMRTELSNAIREASKTQAVKRFEHLRVRSDEGERLVNLSVRPLPGIGNGATVLMVLFEDAGPVSEAGVAASEPQVYDAAEASRVAWLEQELADSRETLQNANEELETSNEELQCTIEELQSSNEELMTSQEELSSINEELQTVNVELEDKVQQLEETSNDLENLLVSTEIGTVFLDLDLNVRRFTPAVLSVINLRESDIGRPLAEIVHKLDYDDLIADTENVLDTLQPKVLDVRTKADRWFSLRISLYRTGNNAIDGVVLTFVDLTERILAERRFLDLLEMTPDAMVITDESGVIVRVNAHAERLFGHPRGQLIGRPVEQLLPPRLHDLHGERRRAYQRNPHTRSMGEAHQQLIGLRADGSEFPADIAIGPIHTPDGTLFVASVRDVTERRRTQAILTRTNKMFHEFCRWNQDRYRNALTTAESLQALSRRLVDEVGYAQCLIALRPDESQSLVPVAQSGIPALNATPLDAGVLANGDGTEPWVVRDTQSAEMPPALHALVSEWGCKALLAAPMTARERERPLGLLAISTVDEDGFPQEEIQLWKTLSTSLAVMLSNCPVAGDETGDST